VTDKQLDALDLDAAVLRELTGLQAFAASRAFADTVMARVRLPQPAALTLLRRAGGWVLQPRRAVALATAYAASVAVALRLAVPWLADHASTLALATSWVGTHLRAGLDSATLAAADWAVRIGADSALRSAAAAGPRLWAIVATLSIGYAVGGYGLHVLLKTPRRNDVYARTR
jgi:hypothetical protein